MKLQKFSRVDHKYHDYYVADKYNLKTFTLDMDEIVNCCQCMKEMRFGDGYTSMEVHTEIGFGYCVCYDCYQEEMKRRYNNEQ